MSKIKLFCFPYAGGSAIIFNSWKQYFGSSIELIPIELAGRGNRIHEPLYKGVTEMIDDIYDILEDAIVNSPYALFGHSMGGMIVYDLTQKIMSKGLPLPSHIFCSGRGAPHIEKKVEKKFHLFNNDKFKEEVLSLGGTPKEFFDHPELMEVFLPLLKNDFRLAETEIMSGEIIPLETNISVFLGKEEDYTSEQCDGWKMHTSGTCSVHYFKGGHFFIHDEIENITRIIKKTLLINSN